MRIIVVVENRRKFNLLPYLNVQRNNALDSNLSTNLTAQMNSMKDALRTIISIKAHQICMRIGGGYDEHMKKMKKKW